MPKGELHVQLAVHYADDEKLAHVSRGARLLYVDALCLCKRLTNDGVLTLAQIEKLCYPDSRPAARRQAGELVASGAWHERGGGYVIAAWLKRNKSRAQLENDRRDAEAAAILGNHRRWHEARGESDPKCPHCHPGSRPDDRPPDPGGDRSTETGANRVVSQETETETETEKKTRTPAAWETPATQHAADLAATAHSPVAHRLVEAYAATCPHRPPSDVLSGLAAEVDKLRAESIPPEHIAAGLDLWGAKPHLTVRLLPRLVHEAVNARPASSPSASGGRTLGDKAAEWIALAQQPQALRAIPGGAP